MAIATCPAEFDQEAERNRRCVAALRLLKKAGVTNCEMVYYHWLAVESDWPGETILYIAKGDRPKTALIAEDGTVTVVDGWDTPGS